MRIRLLLPIVFLAASLSAQSARQLIAPAAELAAGRFVGHLPTDAVVRLDSLGAGVDFAWHLGAAFTAAGIRLSDQAQLARSHQELLRLQDDPAFEGGSRPGGFSGPTHRVWGEVALLRHHRLGKPLTTLSVRLGLEDIATGVTLSRFDSEQTQRHNPPVWTLIALFVASLLAVGLVNVLSHGYKGTAALAVALGLDLAYLAWYVFA
ncbi:MAG: hypothetical protein K8R90_07405 [Candidatus Cloacimonetes bacterium]|nr:hypothetical protein [Candidatus Cloacimonadota bacterium]